MGLQIQSMTMDDEGPRLSVFLSASIPDPSRWDGEFDPLEITDAVSALARAAFTSGIGLITAAHPTIAPLILYVAAEFPGTGIKRRLVTVYQSRLFVDVLPPATRRFEEEGVGSVIWTEQAPGERPEPGRWNRSLQLMRTQMLRETSPTAAVFVGGMGGISEEFALYRGLYPDRPTYALGRPGGEARHLLDASPEGLRAQLRDSATYPAIWRAVLGHMSSME